MYNINYVDIILSKHPDYSESSSGLPNDIALVKLDTQVNITGNYVRTACLPQLHDIFDQNDDCSISGWGNTMGTLKNHDFSLCLSLALSLDI